MTIAYPNGTTIEGIVLARTENWMRVAVRGCRDSVEYTAGPEGSWISETGETVRIGNRSITSAEALDEFICPQDLVERLVGGPEVVTGYPYVALV